LRAGRWAGALQPGLPARRPRQRPLSKNWARGAALKSKQKVVTHFVFLIEFFKGVFWAFRNKGSSKTRKYFFFEKVHLGSSQKMRYFFPPFFFFSLGCFVRFFFYRVFGRFVTRGVQKRHNKKSRENLLSFQKKHSLTYVAFFFFFSRRPLNWVWPGHGRKHPSPLKQGKPAPKAFVLW
jgi:hypothetical protein